MDIGGFSSGEQDSRCFSLIERMVVVAIGPAALRPVLCRSSRASDLYTGHIWSLGGRAVHQAILQAVRSNHPPTFMLYTTNPSLILFYVNSDKSAYVAGAPGVPWWRRNGGVTLQATSRQAWLTGLTRHLVETGCGFGTPGTPLDLVFPRSSLWLGYSAIRGLCAGRIR